MRTKLAVGEAADQNNNSGKQASYFGGGFNHQQQAKKPSKGPILLNPFEMSLNCKVAAQFGKKNVLLEKMCDLAKKCGVLKEVLTERDHRDRTPLLYCIDRNKIDSAEMIIQVSKDAKIANEVHNAVIRKKYVESDEVGAVAWPRFR